MIIGFHLTWTTYGHWFPNDPRGSWSDEVWKPQLLDLKDLDSGRKVTRPRRVAPNALQSFLDSARDELKWNPVCLPGTEINAVGEAFAEAADAIELDIHACAIMLNHVHLIVSRNANSYERIVNRLKGRGSQKVREVRELEVATRRSERVPVWTQGYWVRYIDHPEQMVRAVDYVNANPAKDGPQHWSFIREFDGTFI